MIKSGRFPRHCGMTIITRVGRVKVAVVLALRAGAIVASEAGRSSHTGMVEVCRSPYSCCVAIFTHIAGRQMAWCRCIQLALRRWVGPIMATHTGALRLRVIKRNSGPVQCDVAAGAVGAGLEVCLQFASSRCVIAVMAGKASRHGNNRVIVFECCACPTVKAGVTAHAVI